MLDAIKSIDGAILLWVQEFLRTPVLDAFFTLFTRLGNGGLLWIILSMAMLLYPKTRRAGFYALVALAFGLLCTNIVLKHMVGRIRPWLVVEGLIHLVEISDPNSFPSGHTCAAFAAGCTWARFAQKGWIKVLATGQAVLMGLSRLYVGVHFPTDVLIGAVVGILCAWLALLVNRAVDRKRGEGML